MRVLGNGAACTEDKKRLKTAQASSPISGKCIVLKTRKR